LRRDGATWTTDKDGPIVGLLAAEILARTGKDPGEHYREIEEKHGQSCYTRIDTPATPEQKSALARLTPEAVSARELAGEPIEAIFTRAPANNAPIGGLKLVSRSGWFAARPSGTEDIYKLYAESFQGQAHLNSIVEQARQIINRVLAQVVA
jgi:phosphoglucomutase